ncbi:hypothetical protein E1286_10670 [Nonomuraea terrae]|uniref:Uncharacterized protein n=1 Tax=Nonomuraea terrae TaxID=2530383 RepID=A0A4R4Z2U2_9ACTN|nr:hypothetical protein E1286_10670 [Nonomuraea terrae]
MTTHRARAGSWSRCRARPSAAKAGRALLITGSLTIAASQLVLWAITRDGNDHRPTTVTRSASSSPSPRCSTSWRHS